MAGVVVEIGVDDRRSDFAQTGQRRRALFDVGNGPLDELERRLALAAVFDREHQRRRQKVIAHQPLATEQVGAGGELFEGGNLGIACPKARFGAPIDRQRRVDRHLGQSAQPAFHVVDAL